MTLQDYRINHSKLIEQYQYIESRLELIYSRVCADTYYGGLKEVESDTISRVIGRITQYESVTGTVILPQDIKQRISGMSEVRNYYVHNCYWEMSVTRRNGEVVIKRSNLAQDLLKALRDAEDLHEDLFELYQKLDKTEPKQPSGLLEMVMQQTTQNS